MRKCTSVFVTAIHRAQTSESVDGISRSTDLAFIRVDINDRFSISAGKMCADWGAYEFDYNPIDIYEYSDIIEYADNFLTGVGFTYTPSNKPIYISGIGFEDKDL